MPHVKDKQQGARNTRRSHCAFLCSPRAGHRSGGLIGSFPSLYLTDLWLLPSCFELWHGCFPPRACAKKGMRRLSAEFLATVQTQRSVIGSLGSASENHPFRRCGKSRHSRLHHRRQSRTLLRLLHHTLHTLFHHPLIKALGGTGTEQPGQGEPWLPRKLPARGRHDSGKQHIAESTLLCSAQPQECRRET